MNLEEFAKRFLLLTKAANDLPKKPKLSLVHLPPRAKNDNNLSPENKEPPKLELIENKEYIKQQKHEKDLNRSLQEEEQRILKVKNHRTKAFTENLHNRLLEKYILTDVVAITPEEDKNIHQMYKFHFLSYRNIFMKKHPDFRNLNFENIKDDLSKILGARPRNYGEGEFGYDYGDFHVSLVDASAVDPEDKSILVFVMHLAYSKA